MRRLAKQGLAAFTLFAAGCGPSCPSTCAHLFDKAQCGITYPGRDADELIRECTNECENALARTGEPKYDVSAGQIAPNDENYPALTNEAEAAAWMDCVWERAPEGSSSDDQGCKDLHQTVGYCAPTNF